MDIEAGSTKIPIGVSACLLGRDYRGGLIPLAVPLALLKSFAKRFDHGYVAAQTYLDPHPKQLMLRSFVSP